MLEYFFEQSSRVSQLRRGPLAAHLDGLARELHSKGYRLSSAKKILSIAGQFNIFARLKGITNAAKVDDNFAQRFIKEALAYMGKFESAVCAVQHMMEYLHRNGIIPTPDKAISQDSGEELLNRYGEHLVQVRGFAKITRYGCLCGARKFLRWYRARCSGRALDDLRGSDVLNFIIEALEQSRTIVWKKRFCSDTRSFLRYLRWEEIISRNLDRVVPHMPNWRLASIPRHLPWEKVRELIDSVHSDTAEGKCDKAILLLLATLGLRSHEVNGLRLHHIAWKSSEIHLPSTKGLRERVLPLTNEVGEALKDYIMNGRPQSDRPEIFLKHFVPCGPYIKAGSISQIVRRRLLQARIDAPSAGAHMLRHSLATRMINAGVSVFSIADLLGHASINTTAIYTKVDTSHLASVALPFWEGEGGGI